MNQSSCLLDREGRAEWKAPAAYELAAVRASVRHRGRSGRRDAGRTQLIWSRPEYDVVARGRYRRCLSRGSDARHVGIDMSAALQEAGGFGGNARGRPWRLCDAGRTRR